MAKKKVGYDWKKGMSKLGINSAIVVLSGLLVVWQNDPKYMILIPLIASGLNYFKHKA